MTIKKNHISIIFALSFLVGSSLWAANQDEESNLTTEIIFCAKIEDREPVGEVKKFPADQTEVYAWTRIKGATQPTEVFHKWKYQDDVISSVELKVLSSSYRTWSRATVEGKPGKWSVEVVDLAGRLIAEEKFVVKKR